MYLFGITADTLHVKCIYLSAARPHRGGASCLDDREKRCKKLVDSGWVLNYYLHMP